MTEQTDHTNKRNTWTSRIVDIGGLPLGGHHPVRIQSMTNTPTGDTATTAAQVAQLAQSGCEYVRITAQNIHEAENLANIRAALTKQDVRIPLIADIHFNPAIAETAARLVEKIRINPGNYSDKAPASAKALTDAEYALELEKISDKIWPLVKICNEYGTAIRVGTNHGSLSKRIVDRYGDTPEGMVVSALEFARIFEAMGFKKLVLSMKSSNVKIMVYAYRLLVKRMMETGLDYPLHLGVTEAGAGYEARIKSAAGTGLLLNEGLGDTIRVSLTEAPVNEIPVARAITALFGRTKAQKVFDSQTAITEYTRRETLKTGIIGGGQKPIVIISTESENHYHMDFGNTPPDFIYKSGHFFSYLQEQELSEMPANITKRAYAIKDAEELLLRASAELAGNFVDGTADGLWIENKYSTEAALSKLAHGILQATGSRRSSAEYISCPTCGRTSYDVEKLLSEIKLRTSHLKHLKIAVMGCIVNGPGEMADADYGCVGSGKGTVVLYKGKNPVKRNVPETEAINELIALINAYGDGEIKKG
jgi:(E)-4-hydroxy-3-methylbut-2-enyl-diphosphate synthase